MSDPHLPQSPKSKPAQDGHEKLPIPQLREMSEPEESDNPIPLSLIVAFFLLFAWGGFYFASYKTDFRPDIYDPNWRPGGGAATEEVAFDPLKRGERLFANNCQACHQASGQGVAGAFPPLSESRWVTGDDGTRMVKILLRGMQGPIKVKGNEYNGNMPSYGENGLNWSDRDIAAISTWVRQAWGHSASAVEEEQVAKIRESIASQTGTWMGSEIMAEHPLE